MYKQILMSTVAAITVAAAMGGHAQTFAGPRGPVAFSDIDRDGNGYVTPQEFSDHRDARMAARASQGRLMRNAGQAPSFEGWDKDGDGLLSPTELAAGQDARFAQRATSGRPCWRNR